MFQTKFNLIALTTLLALTGCVQPPRPTATCTKQQRAQYLQELQHWQANGRIAVTNPHNSINVAFTWQQDAKQYRIHFYSPFSSESVTITGDDQQWRVVGSNGVAAEELQLEEHLPFAQMDAWIKGVAAGDSAPQIATYDSCHQLRTLQQDGWQIEYNSYLVCDPISMPEKLSISDGQTKAKILIKDWQK